MGLLRAIVGLGLVWGIVALLIAARGRSGWEAAVGATLVLALLVGRARLAR